MSPVAEAAAQPAAQLVSTCDASAASGSMRRVASAPAFKHASCYQEVSPAAAVAAAAVAATTSTPAKQQRHAARPRAVLPCNSCNGGRCNCLEVYVVSRSFSEFAGPVMKRLHPDARKRLVDMGICHYMTVFKTPDGELVQFDFGPLGGDVQKAHGPLATFLRRARAAAQQHQQQQGGTGSAPADAFKTNSSTTAGGVQQHSSSSSSSRGMVHSPSAPSLPLASLDLAREPAGAESTAALMMEEFNSRASRPKRGVAGEIRECTLHELPSACMYMGRTSLTLDDIRHYNAAQGRQTYTLHEHDCRHYVNSLVQYTTGVERSTQHLKRHYFQSRHADRWLWYGWLISASQLVTDVGNWSHIQAGAAATLLAVTGRSTLASLKTLATPVLPALKSLPVLLPSAGLQAAAAGAAAAAAPGGAAAAGGVGGSAVIGALATTLKLPATLLLRRPLAAGAAAGSAGAAAAAAMRDTTGTAAAGGSGPGSSPPHGGFARSWRPLQSLGDGVAHGFRSAMLGLRRLALGNTRGLQQQLQQHPLTVGEPAFAAAGTPGRGFWGRGSNNNQQQGRGWFRFRGREGGSSNANQLQLVHQPAGVLAAPAAVAAAGGGWGQQPDQQQVRRRPLVQLGQSVGRHVLGFGSAAARVSGQLAALAFGRGGQQAAATAAGAVTVSRTALVHSVSSHHLQQLQQQQQQALHGATLGPGNRSLSLPSLLTSAPDAGSPPLPTSAGGGSSSALIQCSGTVASGNSNSSSLGGPDLAFMWESGSSSISSSSVGSRAAGVGRQVLNLPAPRISWGKRASQAVIVRQ